MMLPRPLQEPGLVAVDVAWGSIAPMQVGEGVRTIGELELMAHLEAGRPVVDTRRPAFREQARIAGTVGIPHEEIGERIGELDRSQVTVLMCNGPQCSATPQAVATLLCAGYPADRLAYYRGGMHDWMTLGLPVEGTLAAG
jgi:rhodanese-related sulfurtransferase